MLPATSVADDVVACWNQAGQTGQRQPLNVATQHAAFDVRCSSPLLAEGGPACCATAEFGSVEPDPAFGCETLLQLRNPTEPSFSSRTRPAPRLHSAAGPRP